MTFSSIEDAVAAIASGQMVIVVDDEDRENEGDLVMAAEKVTPQAIAFMMNHGKGLICTSVTAEQAEALQLAPMVSNNSDPMKTAFTVSIDLVKGCSTGISASDRSATILAMTDPTTPPEAFSRPGHVFPLIAKRGGVIERPGHTEASGDLCRLAGLAPSGVICEIAKDDGSMARLADLIPFAQHHGLHIVTIKDLIAHRKRTEAFVEKVSECEMPTRYGIFRAHVYRDLRTGVEHMALVGTNAQSDGEAIVRVHSECLTGEAFGSARCDCGEQLERAMSIVAGSARGCLIYLRGHEGRGIGLGNKMRAYGLQDAGADTFEANEMLGLPADGRDYFAAAGILKDLGMTDITLLTNNPGKIDALEEYGITVSKRRGILVASTAANRGYLATKAEKFGHFLESARALAG